MGNINTIFKTYENLVRWYILTPNRQNIMETLKKIITYWLKCVKEEDALENEGIGRTAQLSPFSYDPFMFNQSDAVSVEDKDLLDFLKNTAEKDMYYGYPIISFTNNNNRQNILPLFQMRVHFNEKNTAIKKVGSAELNQQALQKIGFREGMIEEIDEEMNDILSEESELSGTDLAEKCMRVILNRMPEIKSEKTNTEKLTNNKKQLTENRIHNKSCFFAIDDPTLYNKSLIQDLEDLRKRKDTDTTALSFITKTGAKGGGFKRGEPFVLPYQMNDYQIDALRNVFRRKLTVITGPPGTGKSQFIMNLIVNLFMNDKTVLFVSQTNQAVKTINERLNDDFQDILFPTGNAEKTNNLHNRLDALTEQAEHSEETADNVTHDDITNAWEEIRKKKGVILTIEKYQKKIENLYSKGGFISFLKRIYYGYKIEKIHTEGDVKKEIRELEKRFFRDSKKYVQSVYLRRILENQGDIGTVRHFFTTIQNRTVSENTEVAQKALKVLKIWSCTLKSLKNNFPLDAGMFDYVIFDEASQIDLPSAAPALYRAKNTVVVGDPKQLSHISHIHKDTDEHIAKECRIAKDDLYTKVRYHDISLYLCAEHFLPKRSRPILFKKHYRSTDQIITLCNEVFYGGSLVCASNHDYRFWPDNVPIGVQWEDCSGITEKTNGSKVNKAEAEKLLVVLIVILNKIRDTEYSVGIVTPYAGQRQTLERLVNTKVPEETREEHAIEVLTAHKFQGSEKDIMLFSAVLSEGNDITDTWYNNQPQIINVALSRAKHLLYIIGDKNFCAGRPEQSILHKIAKTYNKVKREERRGRILLRQGGEPQTPAEEKLFTALQKKMYIITKHGYTLIPQYPEKRYRIDFALINKEAGRKIAIECDGSHHEIIGGLPVLDDIEKDTYLTHKGWEILRFQNHKIFNKIDFVTEEILKEIF